MKMSIYSVFDSVAKAYLPPFYMLNDDTALRVYADCANDPAHQFCKFPTDFTLFNIGEFEDSTGVITPSLNPTNLGLASMFKQVSLIPSSGDDK